MNCREWRQRIFKLITSFFKFIHTGDLDKLLYIGQNVFVDILVKILFKNFGISSWLQSYIGMKIMTGQLSPIILNVLHRKQEIEIEMCILRHIADNCGNFIWLIFTVNHNRFSDNICSS